MIAGMSTGDQDKHAGDGEVAGSNMVSPRFLREAVQLE